MKRMNRKQLKHTLFAISFICYVLSGRCWNLYQLRKYATSQNNMEQLWKLYIAIGLKVQDKTVVD